MKAICCANLTQFYYTMTIGRSQRETSQFHADVCITRKTAMWITQENVDKVVEKRIAFERQMVYTYN